jgi:site-specific DNA-cytosine methylase
MADQNAIELPSELKGKKFRIRKLTPRECFRLMGVDDKDIDKIQAAGISNSSQYKLAGNSIVVDVLYHLFRKMFIEKDAEKQKKGQQLSLF